MDYIYNSPIIQIDLTNPSIYSRGERLYHHIESKRLEQILDSIQDWPNIVAIRCTEQLLNTPFDNFIPDATKGFSKEKLVLWILDSSNKIRKKLDKSLLPSKITDTFNHIQYIAHAAYTSFVCPHRSADTVIDEALPYMETKWDLINGCKLQKLWTPVIIDAGAYFCDLARYIDEIFYGGKYAWKIIPGWWKRPPESFQEQIAMLCTKCDLCLTSRSHNIAANNHKCRSPRRNENTEEEYSRNINKICYDENEKTSINSNEIKIIDSCFSFYPTNYKNNLKNYKSLCQQKKDCLTNLNLNIKIPTAFKLDTEADFAHALSSIHTLPLNAVPSEFSVTFKSQYFNPLREPYPFVLAGRYDENQVYFRAMLLHFRQILDDTAFSELVNTEITPALVKNLAHRYREMVQERYITYAKKLAKKLAGKKVYLWDLGLHGGIMPPTSLKPNRSVSLQILKTLRLKHIQ